MKVMKVQNFKMSITSSPAILMKNKALEEMDLCTYIIFISTMMDKEGVTDLRIGGLYDA